jgi:hypothetical protein
LPLKEHEEVEIDVRQATPPGEAEGDPRGFVGFIRGGVKGMPIAAHHDKFLDQDQYAHLKAYLRRLMVASEWKTLGREEKLDRFVHSCKDARPDLKELWDDMDRLPLVWSNAFDYCTRAIEREAAASRG